MSEKNKNNPFIIKEDDIFKNDKLKRKDAIENLSHLIISTKEAFTLSINADWGAGKTTFVKLWQAHLKKEHQVDSIYFSAWEDDFSKEPLISILGEINNYIEDNFKDERATAQKFEKVKEFGGKVLRRGIPAFIKGVTAGVLDIDNGLENAIGALTEETTKELINKYSEDKEVTQSFKDAIQILLENISSEKAFVIFIDELDRCRPLYAIELLERVKHIFGIDGLIFVLSIDKKQLSESIKSQYGNIDANSYLKRFIDLEYNLTNSNVDEFCDNLYYSVYKLDKILALKEIKREYREYNELAMLKYLVKSMNLNLREIEQIFIQINIIFKTINPRLFEIHFRVIVFFIVLKLKDLRLYDELINKRKPVEEILTIIFQNIVKNDLYADVYEDIKIIIKAIVLSTSKTDDEMDLLINQQEEISSGMPDGEEKSQHTWLINTLRFSEKRGMYRLNKAVETVIKKIEFVDKFNFDGIKESS
ncbi:MAG TPA: P-loop NTPase fold protein [Sulfurimonas sp.]|uniref:KAP family P-loop NTPase fold protein n=1 Tax=Sulfurimonas sp. TaxID=2022749 RepID=UPI002CE23CB8|nr:P-loop NTPase fold protein [Sulfurimonas sp.]HUH43070.1 P-loop NTPase fold protein [Sulfurimonas sp.]